MVRKTEEELAKAVRHLETLVDTTRAQVHQRFDSQLQDKVGVEEVQQPLEQLGPRAAVRVGLRCSVVWSSHILVV